MGYKPKGTVVKLHRPAVGEDGDGLMGATEAARELGVKQSNLRELVGLPPTYTVLAMGSVWLAQDIHEFKAWRELHPPRPGPKPYSYHRAVAAA